MNKVIAVEGNLSPVKSFLSEKGCNIIDIKSAQSRRVDAVVISGSDENLMSMQDIAVNAPVINAKGKSPQQVWDDISRK